MSGGVLSRLGWLWRIVNGDADYGRYLAHVQAAHPQDVPMSRRSYYLAKMERRYNSINRCC